MARQTGHRQAPGGDPELRQHRRAVQRQDRHADRRRDRGRAARRSCAAHDRREVVRARRAQQRASRPASRSPLDDGHPARTTRGRRTDGYHKLDEVPFDFERRRVSVVRRSGRPPPADRQGRAGERPAGLLRGTSRRRQPRRWTRWPRGAHERSSTAEREGLPRARGGVPRIAAAARPTASPTSATSSFVGFVAFADPPLEGRAPRRCARCAPTACEVKILTGDNELVTRHVCARGRPAGRADRARRRRSSAWTTRRSGAVAERTTVFARVSPAQKNRIVARAASAAATSSATSATASTTRRRCTPRTSASRCDGAVDVAKRRGRHHPAASTSLAVLHDGRASRAAGPSATS